MIALDASAVIAILLDEPERRAFSNAIVRGSPSCIAAPSVLEASIRANRLGGPELDAALDVLLAELAVEVAPVGPTELSVARDAYRRYGKGMGHPAQLNFGDCFSYALARTRDLPLLFKGDDFAKTDIRPALA